MDNGNKRKNTINSRDFYSLNCNLATITVKDELVHVTLKMEHKNFK